MKTAEIMAAFDKTIAQLNAWVMSGEPARKLPADFYIDPACDWPQCDCDHECERLDRHGEWLKEQEKIFDEESKMKPITGDHMPDWMPPSSASQYPEGTRQYGSTGQLWQVRNRQWVRITAPKVVDEDACPGHVASEDNPRICGKCGININSLREGWE